MARCLSDPKDWSAKPDNREFESHPSLKFKLDNMKQDLKLGDVVLATWGYNDITKKPFSFLYEFGYYTEYGCVVYKHGERNMQDAAAFKEEQVKLATPEDIRTNWWGLN